MAKLKQKFKDKAASSMDSFNRALQTKQQEMDTGLSEKNMALAAANQALEDAQAASTLALQVCCSSVTILLGNLCTASMPGCLPAASNIYNVLSIVFVGPS